MQTVVIALAWLAQILGFGAAATALSDPVILQDHGKLIVAMLATALAFAGALPSIIGTVRAWWVRVKDAATGPSDQGGFIHASLVCALSAVATAILLLAACATANLGITPAQAIASAAKATETYTDRTIMLESAGVITPTEAIERHKRASTALAVVSDANIALATCERAGTPTGQCFTVQGVLQNMPELTNQAEIELLRRLPK